MGATRTEELLLERHDFGFRSEGQSNFDLSSLVCVCFYFCFFFFKFYDPLTYHTHLSVPKGQLLPLDLRDAHINLKATKSLI